MQPYTDLTDPRLVKALAHPVRVQALALLSDRVASPSELARELGMPVNSVSYHVRRLVALGFLELVKKTPRRGAVEHYYTAILRPLITDGTWGELPPIVVRAMVSAGLEHVGRQVNAAAAAGGFDRPDAALLHCPLTIDEEGWRALAGELQAMHDRIQTIAAESAERLDGGEGGDGIDAAVELMLYQSAPAGAPREVPSEHHARRRQTARTPS